MRLFIAIDTPSDIKAGILSIQQQLKAADARVTWEPADKLHTTLKFLGETQENALPDITKGLEAACLYYPAVALRYRSLGCFPSRRDPKVVWVGIDDVSGNLSLLHQTIETEVERFGFGRERRPFTPHLTLGRIKSNIHIDSLLTRMETVTFESPLATIRDIILVKSDLKPTGSVYTILKSIPLNG